eukprot:TRINITY_DN19720_c0_g1::TRINITY_DN19720_c0_g1_i1::g.3230::m.3230 TRINITY_DN19720_c0_g1::TRINITY_DN19720_c0_g1_i1::g.3230  ORF type:complete len:185 (-),score=12.31,Transcrip_act/PF04949.8/1.4e-08,DUF2730/PF10805.3/3e+02,DUF2730/PF10805.3/2.6,DUF2730/PF10805.3/7.6,Trans_reg_C/PF00486.23/5.4e+03,Trans_reg_C/PF00486.23/1.4,AAA_13/PF13166.1/4.5,Phasin/PF05597.6/4.1e+02,Phasin/PF05597.6/0.054,Phasin/PF05597.6/5.5e+02,DUF745/PF05335.8/1.3e+02,DUF745/PF05335.8/1e+02,DUF745/PF05335.8/0.12,PLRV_ORF5/PF016
MSDYNINLAKEIAQLKQSLEATREDAVRKAQAQKLNPSLSTVPAKKPVHQTPRHEMTAEEIEKEIQRQERALRDKLQQRFGQVRQEEAMLQELSDELKTIEAPTRVDVKELRRKIEVATREEQKQEERVRRAQSELQDAKLCLTDAKERKRILSEQLSSIMHESESRKQAKLKDLNAKLSTLSR